VIKETSGVSDIMNAYGDVAKATWKSSSLSGSQWKSSGMDAYAVGSVRPPCLEMY